MRGKLTHKLALVYVQGCYTRLSRWNKLRFERCMERLSESQIMAIRKASHQCARLGATPLAYVSAQFDVFDNVSTSIGRTILPMPHHLHGEKAEARYQARLDGSARRKSEADLISAARRSVPGSEGHVFDPEVQVRVFYRDSRKLANLVSLLHLTETEVMVQHPGEFSVDFLMMNGARGVAS